MLVAMLLAAMPTAATAQGHCSRETLTVRGTPVTISYCPSVPATSGPEVSVPVAETFSASSGSFSRSSTLKFVSGEGPARVVENVDLDGVGLTGTLHLTLVYAGGEVRVESALLTPGAIIIK